MARDADLIRTADICDEFGDELLVCELALNDYAGRDHFHGEVRTFATYEGTRLADRSVRPISSLNDRTK